MNTPLTMGPFFYSSELRRVYVEMDRIEMVFIGFVIMTEQRMKKTYQKCVMHSLLMSRKNTK